MVPRCRFSEGLFVAFCLLKKGTVPMWRKRAGHFSRHDANAFLLNADKGPDKEWKRSKVSSAR
jgi:hypothetical protein